MMLASWILDVLCPFFHRNPAYSIKILKDIVKNKIIVLIKKNTI